VIKFGIRQSFDKIEQIEDRYANKGIAVELALPYYWDIYEPVRAHLGDIAEKIKLDYSPLLAARRYIRTARKY
jgi:hypothetical protein